MLLSFDDQGGAHVDLDTVANVDEMMTSIVRAASRTVTFIGDTKNYQSEIQSLMMCGHNVIV